MPLRPPPAGRLILVLLATGAVLTGPTRLPAAPSAVSPPRAPSAAPPLTATPDAADEAAGTVAEDDFALAARSVIEPLVDPELDLRASPVPVPLRLRLPSIGVDTDVLAVGIDKSDAMAAPVGRAADRVWQQAFWYRGSATPGAPSTTVMAGHVTDAVGRPGAFAKLTDLRAGATAVVRDTRTGVDVTYTVTHAVTYALRDTTKPDVLTDIYGAGPVEGTRPQLAADGLAHLTLITCTGTFRNGTHDRRHVVHATARVAGGTPARS